MMFFGLNSKPLFLEDVPIKREVRRVCSKDKGKCRGSWVRTMEDGSKKMQFAYYDDDINSVVFDDGVCDIKCTAIVHGETICWYETVGDDDD